ncbi:MAG: hypothetical protein DSZ24_07245 [Thermodesulfatator sp.]|nr:MAG: hypothetical protein DSZ24_07245 [Thermodesulfatator sp.]
MFEKLRKSWLMFFVLVGLSFYLSSCKRAVDIKFSHQLHVEENGISCDQCHPKQEDGTMGLPTMDTCSDCHEIDLDNPSEKCLMCHTSRSASKDYEVSPLSKPMSYKDLNFSHEYHEDLDVECSFCHIGIEKNKDLGTLKYPTMDVCTQCHNGEEAPAECETCHKVIRKDRPPANHGGDWTFLHGREARVSERVCHYCHQKNMCQECHQREKPRDHQTFVWKIEDHGEEATHDRRRCVVCHSAGFCSDCHRQMPPSHKRADWLAFDVHNGHAQAARRNFRSCKVCHETSECVRCHNSIIMRQP